MSTPDAFPGLLAEGVTLAGTSRPNEVYAGVGEVVCDEVVVDDDLARGTILIRNSDGTASEWDGTNYPGDGALTVLKIPYAILAADTADGASGPIYTGGYFNFSWLLYNGQTSPTLAVCKRGFVGTMISISEPRGSNDPIALPAL